MMDSGWKYEHVIHMDEFCEPPRCSGHAAFLCLWLPRLPFLLLLLLNISARVAPVTDLGPARLMFWILVIFTKPGGFFLPSRSLAQLWALCSCLLLASVASPWMRLPPLRFQASKEGARLRAFTFLPLTFCEL